MAVQDVSRLDCLAAHAGAQHKKARITNVYLRRITKNKENTMNTKQNTKQRTRKEQQKEITQGKPLKT